jgi:LysR family transcriptional regulator, glycine cleavage system transcriptional activator
MRNSRVPVNWLRAFEVAARHLSLTAAATELSVTPAAVSQQIRLLELRLGERLFVRHSRGLRLTWAGEALLPACRESFERLDSVITEIFGQRGSRFLTVRVSLGFARHWLLQQVYAFVRANPDIAVRLLATVWFGSPLESGADVEIRLAPEPPRALESHQLTHDEIFPVCSPRVANAAPRLRHPRDLRKQTLLTTVGFLQSWPHWFAAAGVEYEPPPIGIEFDSMPLALEMASLGQGVALARTSYVADLLRARRLKRLFGVRLAASDNLYLTLPRRLEASAPAVRFRDWILATIPGG